MHFLRALLVCFASLCISLRAEAATVIRKLPYHGWDEAFMLGNGSVEVIVVPAIGRIMQMRFAGEDQGPFWEDRAMDGKMPDPNSSEWGNFGGDKSWPAPQGDWPRVTGRGWPPPRAFDSMAVTAEARGETLVLTSKIDAHYGIQTERHITLASDRAEMNVNTYYFKREGSPIRVSIWIITQFHHPERMFMPLPAKTLFPSGYNKQSEVVPSDLKLVNGMLSCTRSTKDSTKIGSDASRLLWADDKYLFEVYSAREPESEFPDNNSSAEIYTNPDPKKYIELELLGPFRTLKPGESMSRNQRYRIFRRQQIDLETQIRDVAHEK